MNPIVYKGESYVDDYQLFMESLETQSEDVSILEVSKMILRNANYFVRYNTSLARANKLYRMKTQEVYRSDDNGKPISVAKAEILAEATPEAAVYREVKAHLQNIETINFALKALQNSLLNEHVRVAP